MAKVERKPEGWVAAGTKALGRLLCERWEEKDDAQQDVESEVRTILRKQGVDLGR